MIKGILFDMDGTMFDTEVISMEAMRQIGPQFGATFDEETMLSFMGLPTEEIQKLIAEKYGKDFDFVNFRLEKIAFQNARIEENGVPIKTGLLELLTYAKEQNILCAVATSTSRARAEGLLEKAGIIPYFAAIVCGDDGIKNGKPAPDIFLYAAGKLGLSPEECIGIEDSRNGILSLHHAHIFSVLVPDVVPVTEEMRDAANLECKDLLEVLEYIKENK